MPEAFSKRRILNSIHTGWMSMTVLHTQSTVHQHEMPSLLWFTSIQSKSELFSKRTPALCKLVPVSQPQLSTSSGSNRRRQNVHAPSATFSTTPADHQRVCASIQVCRRPPSARQPPSQPACMPARHRLPTSASSAASRSSRCLHQNIDKCQWMQK